ncbi:hypothetical protein H4R18_003942 [Coemansia javaensis]|uniref:Uncharacterized protein n=1 Tax=Coemansia javaensis TaxID=2761396 RepID=A0A9W8LHU0_9FUNG|nr:hypothetical protein H4R18_003942 [Coemansia javaensis]
MDAAVSAGESPMAVSAQEWPQNPPLPQQHPDQGGGEARHSVVCGGVARIDVAKLEQHISNEVQTYSQGGFPRQSERYYKLMSVLHITRMLYHDGHCQPIHREFYRRLAQIHHQQQQQQQLQQQLQQVSFAH